MATVEPHQMSETGPAARYFEDGYLFPIGVFTRDEALAWHKRILTAQNEALYDGTAAV